MSSAKIILADPDLHYLLKLQIRLMQGVSGDVEIESITDPDYFRTYFSVPRDAGCLIIFESMYSEELLKHNIDNIIILTESGEEEISPDGKIRKIEKYSSPNQIFNQIKSTLTSRIIIDQTKDVDVLTFYSASGGLGKTTLSLSMAKHLAGKHYRVLYINTESIQSHSYYLEDDRPVTGQIMMNLETSSSSVYGILKGSIRQEGFSYVPPLPSPLAFYGTGREIYNALIEDVCSSRDYDYVVVDTDSIFDNVISDILKQSTKVFFISNQEEAIVNTADRFLSDIDSSSGRFVFIRNNYSGDEESKTEQLDRVSVDQYVPHFDGMGRELLERISNSDSILKMALLIE